jgi:hypothetical protein
MADSMECEGDFFSQKQSFYAQERLALSPCFLSWSRDAADFRGSLGKQEHAGGFKKGGGFRGKALVSCLLV